MELLAGKCRAVLCAVVGWNEVLVVAYWLQHADVSVCFVLFVCLACSYLNFDLSPLYTPFLR